MACFLITVFDEDVFWSGGRVGRSDFWKTFLTKMFFCLVVERGGVLFEKYLEKQLGEDVSYFGGRQEWRAFCKNGLTERTFPRFAVERLGMLFGEKDIFSPVVCFLGNSFLTKTAFFSLVFERSDALF